MPQPLIPSTIKRVKEFESLIAGNENLEHQHAIEARQSAMAPRFIARLPDAVIRSPRTPDIPSTI